MNVSTGSHTQAALQASGEVGDNVAENIIGNDHVKLPRIANHLGAKSVHVHVLGFNLRIFGTDFFEHALPQAPGIGHGIGFVGHENATAPSIVSLLVVGAILKRVPNDASHALIGIYVLLDRNFVVSSLIGDAATINIRSFGILSNHNKINVLRFHSF